MSGLVGIPRLLGLPNATPPVVIRDGSSGSAGVIGDFVRIGGFPGKPNEKSGENWATANKYHHCNLGDSVF